MTDLSVNICGVSFKNPVITASGTFGFGKEFTEYIDLNNLGGITVKGITLKPRKGNPPPRIHEAYAGILNSVGLQNPGVENFVKNELPFLKKLDTRIIVNIAGNTVEEYCEITKILSEEPVDFIELNISCPNVKEGGIAFGTSPKMVFNVVDSVKKYSKKPIIVKLSPNVADIKEIAKSAEDAGADAISLINTLLGMAVDINKRRPVFKNIVAGLSGPAIKPIALRMVWEVCNAVKIPVVGMGGIMTSDDAVEFLIAGASLVSVGTANLINPQASIEILEGIREYCLKNGINRITELIGSLEY